MDFPIFFIEAIPPGDIITLGEETSKHVVQVLRMKPTEKLQLTDGQGSLVTAEILDDHKKKCTVKILDKTFVTRKNSEVSICMALVKNASRFEWFLEKATEIGVTEIVPLITERTEKQHFRFDRMRQILVSAMLQSKQVWLPQMTEPTPLTKVLSTSKYAVKLIAHCEDEQKANITDYQRLQSVQILIGPEGDFKPDEIELAKEAGYIPVALGNTRLRTETAGVVAATILAL